MNITARWLLPLLLVLAPALAAPAAAQTPIEGQDYVRIAEGPPWQPLEGQIEVAEIFSYACHVCDEFRPILDAWARRQADDVRVSHVPAAYRRQDPFATMFFATRALGQSDAVHAATFDAVHRRGLLARNATVAEISTFYAGLDLGLNRARLAEAAQSVEVQQKLDAAHEFLVRSGAQGTPTLVINGKYRVQGRTLQDVLRIADQLIAMEREP
ncbi:thiol:disulfide interchange protein DsbA/DsbL [Luteimonas sp. A478]